MDDSKYVIVISKFEIADDHEPDNGVSTVPTYKFCKFTG